MVDIFDGHIDVAIITGIDDMGMHTITAFNDFKAKIGKAGTIVIVLVYAGNKAGYRIATNTKFTEISASHRGVGDKLQMQANFLCCQQRKGLNSGIAELANLNQLTAIFQQI
jgi:hypothetical protein